MQVALDERLEVAVVAVDEVVVVEQVAVKVLLLAVHAFAEVARELLGRLVHQLLVLLETPAVMQRRSEKPCT